jgi:hypothetical protein
MADLLELLIGELRLERLDQPVRGLARGVGDDVEFDRRMFRHVRILARYRSGMSIVAGEAVGRELVSALAAQDWARLEGCFAPDAHFFATTLSKTPLRERTGAQDTAALLAAWFGDGDPLELVSSTVEPVAGNVHVAYRFRSFEEGAWHLVEQQAFCEVGSKGIERMHLACSGFQRLEPSP